VFKTKALPQPELFVPSARLARPATSSFYTKLEQTLASFDFGGKARQICAPAYSESNRGRPGVVPAVYFKMLMVGFFENISSERGIAECCSDSISIRFFLGYDLTQSIPDHSTLSVIRDRLGQDGPGLLVKPRVGSQTINSQWEHNRPETQARGFGRQSIGC
jgi:transposase